MLNSATVVDAHVHVHRNMDVSVLLDAALRNLGMAATTAGARTWDGVLMLAEMREADWFEEVARTLPRFGRWSIASVASDPVSVQAIAPAGRLTIIAGRQIVTAEGIEVLVLATRARIDDGLSLAEAVAAAVSHEAIVVLPWGAGKWLGRRGAMVSEFIKTGLPGVFAGDNGGRPAFWPEDGVFTVARSKGQPVLPGTDPLPLPGEEQRVGSFGFLLEGDLPADSPGLALRERLRRATPGEIRNFGRLQGALPFFRNQAALRLR